MESSSWEEVICELGAMRRKRSKYVGRFVAVHKLLWIAERMRKIRIEAEVSEARKQTNSFNRYGFISNYIHRSLGYGTEADMHIFKCCITHNVPVRICFVLGKEIETFLETCLTGKIVCSRKRYKPCVVGLDDHLGVADLTFLYSSAPKRLHLPRALEGCFEHSAAWKAPAGTAESIFRTEDLRRLQEIPTSISRMKTHPLYAVESLLGRRCCIFPKRPVYGHFRGEAVHSRENVQQLHTKRQLYLRGRAIKPSTRPYRIDEGTELYAPWQTEDIVVESLDDGSAYRTMDYFHKNHLPRDCMYSDARAARDVAELLGVRYRRCTVGFSGRVPVQRGIFVHKKHAYAYLNCLREYCFYESLIQSNRAMLRVIGNWERLLRKTKWYLEIRRRIG